MGRHYRIPSVEADIDYRVPSFKYIHLQDFLRMCQHKCVDFFNLKCWFTYIDEQFTRSIRIFIYCFHISEDYTCDASDRTHNNLIATVRCAFPVPISYIRGEYWDGPIAFALIVPNHARFTWHTIIISCVMCCDCVAMCCMLHATTYHSPHSYSYISATLL